MKYKEIIFEDFSNYKKASMFIGLGTCNWKCCIDAGIDIGICQNSPLAKCEDRYILTHDLVSLYIANPITESVVFGGLEPLDAFGEVYEFIRVLREEFNNHDDIVIYTGYYEKEIKKVLTQLKRFDNIILKTGRFIPNQEKCYDEVLGVHLANKEQKARRI